jgi:hypothetical protein
MTGCIYRQLVICVAGMSLGALVGATYLTVDVFPYCTPPHCATVERDASGQAHYYSLVDGREYFGAEIGGDQP